MAYLVSGVLLILVLAQGLEAFPRRVDDRNQDLQIRELITALMKLKTSGHDLRSALDEKRMEEGREETDEAEGSKEKDAKVKEVDEDNVSTKRNEENLRSDDERSEERRAYDTSTEEEEEVEEEDATSNANKDVTEDDRSSQKKGNTRTGTNVPRGDNHNGTTREHGHGHDIDREDVNPNSKLAHLLGQFEVDNHGTKMRANNLHEDKLEKVEGESHDLHPTPPPRTDTDESPQQPEENDFTRRNFIKKDNRLWPGGIVPYEIDSGAFSPEQVNTIETAMQEMRVKTCVDFQPRTSVDASALGHNAFVNFINAAGSGCWSYVGKVFDGQQDLGLDSAYCVNNPTILHEMGHAIGMEHEQSRWDRDDYLDMQWDNIKGGEDNVNMQKSNTRDANPYDYGSILQYYLKAFAVDYSKYSMRFHDRELEFLAGQATGLTFYDVQDITSAYRCTEKCGTNVPTCQNGGFVDHNCDCYCPAGLDGADCSQVVTDTGCGGIIDVTSGPRTIESPNYPQNYDVGANCAWLVQGPVGKLIQLTITDLDLSSNVNSNKCYHWLEMRYNLMGQTGLKKCGTFSNEVYTTTWEGTPNIMYLMFDSAYADDKDPSKGFSMTVEAVIAGCASNPCIHGSCQDDPTSDFKCICEDKYEGVICDKVKASSSFVCDFESADTCFFANVDSDEFDVFDWTRHTGGTASASTGPSQAYGGAYYMYAEVSFLSPGTTAALLTTDALPVADWCLSFWYHKYGATPGKLEVLGAIDGKVWWSESANLGDQWNQASIEMPLSIEQKAEKFFDNVFGKIVLLATVGSSFRGDIAIDDLHLQRCVTPVHENCDFEIGNECFLSQSQTDDFDWIVDQVGETPTSLTGPTVAHEGTHYAFIEASDPYLNDTAVLGSVTTFTAGEYCVSFYYHMYGKKMGALVVSTLADSTGVETDVFLKTGDQGQLWNHGVVSLDESDDFKLLFTAIRGSSYSSDLALDDVTFTSGGCACLSSPCLNGGTCVSDPNAQDGYQCTCSSGLSGGRCEQVSVTTPLTCSFEDGEVCFLQQASGDDFDWTVKEGPTATPNTGPSSAAEGDNYAYIETSGVITEGYVAKFTTYPMSFEEGDRCLTFKYHMYGYSTGTLSVCNGDTEIFHQTGDQGDKWNFADVDVHMSGSTQLVITAFIVQNREFGDIAIDDVKLIPGSC